MRYDSKTMPDSVRKLLPPDAKKALGTAGLCVEELLLRDNATSEKALQKQVGQYLNLLEIPFYTSRMDRATTGKVGTPDFILCLRIRHRDWPNQFFGLFVAIETKVGDGKLTDEQAVELDKIRKAGGVDLVARSLGDVKKLIDDLTQGTK